ncbi:hypothetical protein AVEN_195388-1 [Araneus ventricosus]|uniref:Uncharacterized protein n=1 Tax=Araneus ventricosus TaxID=182803 RepID=A0A4Y2UE44_ARAVE|nr:hypothetical protein AVEN_195388-1 [Araneus ventricosus]
MSSATHRNQSSMRISDENWTAVDKNLEIQCPHFPFGAFGHETEIRSWEEERPSFTIWRIRSENCNTMLGRGASRIFNLAHSVRKLKYDPGKRRVVGNSNEINQLDATCQQWLWTVRSRTPFRQIQFKPCCLN